MQLKENYENIFKRIADCAFYTALTIELVLVILDKSVYIIQYDGQWFRITFVLFLIKLVLTRYEKNEWIAIGIFSLLGLVSYLVSGQNDILRLVVMVAACKDIKHDMLLKYILGFTLAGCLILVLLSFMGIGTFSITGDFGRGDINTRYCLGLGHPNGLHCMYWALSSLYLYIYGHKHKWISSIVVLVGNIGLFILTDSRTAFITTVLTVFLFVILNIKLTSGFEKALRYLTNLGIAIALLVSSLMMSHKFFWTKLRRVDELLTGRIIGTHMSIMQAKTFFWLPFSGRGHDAQTDLGIIKAFYWYGYVPVIIFATMCCILVSTAFKEGDRLALMVVATIVFYSIFEAHEISEFLARNYAFFLFGKYWTKMIRIGETVNV